MLDYAAFPQQRQSFIRQLLQSQGRVVCVKLAEQLQVSEHTIRRDLKELAQEGICKRVYGGAVSIIPHSESFTQRTEHNRSEKDAIAARCAALIKNNGCIFIDASSTNLALAKALPDNLTLSVVTNSPLIAVELMKHSGCEVIILGGKIQSAIGGSLGITSQQQIKNIYFDQSFLGGCAMDPEAGLTVFDYEDAEFKKAVVKQSNEIIVGLTSDKIPGIARYCVASCDDITALVVENSLSNDLVAIFSEKEIKIELIEQATAAETTANSED